MWRERPVYARPRSPPYSRFPDNDHFGNFVIQDEVWKIVVQNCHDCGTGKIESLTGIDAKGVICVTSGL